MSVSDWISCENVNSKMREMKMVLYWSPGENWGIGYLNMNQRDRNNTGPLIHELNEYNNIKDI